MKPDDILGPGDATSAVFRGDPGNPVVKGPLVWIPPAPRFYAVTHGPWPIQFSWHISVPTVPAPFPAAESHEPDMRPHVHRGPDPEG